MSLTIDTGVKVTLHFSLGLEDGQIIDSNFQSQPATFTLGDGNLLPGFESKLVGLKVGDKKEFLIAPSEAFGQHNPANVQHIARNQFDQEDIQPGAVFSFQNGDGEMPGVVTAVEDDQVIVDFNHPLSGRSIVFRVDIVGLSAGTLH